MSIGSRGQFIATVAANQSLCREHFRLVLKLPAFPATQPGQFVQIACSDVDAAGHDWATASAMLRRPFSLAGRREVAGGVELDIIHRVVGIGTRWLSRLQEGDAVSALGPLGNSFRLPTDREMAILVGGGVGIPPMLYLAEKLAGRKAVAMAGATTRENLLLPLKITSESGNGTTPEMIIEEFSRHGIPSVITTDDGSFGLRGFVTQALERYLDTLGSQSSAPEPVIYTCGPELMMKAVAAIAAQRGLECQIAVERAMACGMGTCQSCCIRVKKPEPTKPPLAGSDWCYRLACTDGPVFLGRELLW